MKSFLKNSLLFIVFFVNLVYNSVGDDMKDYKKIIKLYFSSVKGFNEFESVPRDFGTGDLLFSSEIHTLQAIGKNPEINLTDLSILLDISKSGTSKFIRKLLEKDLIVKGRPLNNKKEVIYTLTEKGRIAYQSHEAFDKKMFGTIHDILSELTDEENEFLESFLSKLVTQVNQLNQ